MKVLVICDRPGWAFDAIAGALVEHSPPWMELKPFYLKGNEAALQDAVADADIVYAIHWSLIADVVGERRFLAGPTRKNTVRRAGDRFSFIDPGSTLVGVHAHHDWDNRRTDPGVFPPPPPALIGFLSRFRAVNLVSRRLTMVFQAAGLRNGVYTPNGVDAGLFRPMKPIGAGERLRVGYAGTKKRDWKEGISEHIEPLAEIPWLDVKIATPEDGRHIPRHLMPDFYNDVDVYLCASRSEGFSLAVLEAAACGRPIVTTRVGGSEDLVKAGMNGYFVDRDRTEILRVLRMLHQDRSHLRQLGQHSRRMVEAEWSWDSRAPAWISFIQAASNHANAPA